MALVSPYLSMITYDGVANNDLTKYKLPLHPN